MAREMSEAQSLREKHKGMSKARAAAVVAASKNAPVREIKRVQDSKKTKKKGK
jgi:hypothetical protein